MFVFFLGGGGRGGGMFFEGHESCFSHPEKGCETVNYRCVDVLDTINSSGLEFRSECTFLLLDTVTP